MNDKGFTLIELMATITVMGIFMAIALPNITSTVDKSKRTSYINDARKLVSLAKYKFEGDMNTTRPSSSEYRKYNITDLDMSELQTGPNEGKYDSTYSYVVVKYDSHDKRYVYCVQLIEKFTANNNTYYRGVKYTDNKNLYKENAKIRQVTDALLDTNSLNENNTTLCS